MKIEKTKLAWKIMLPFQHHDERGNLYQTWNDPEWLVATDKDDLPWIPRRWVQENVIIERFGALRGMHNHSAAWLLMTCLHGHVVIGLLDPRTGDTERFEFRVGIDDPAELNTYQILVPPGIANGHSSLWNGSVFHYLWSERYEDEKQTTYRWNGFNIDWGVKDPILSERDK